MRPLPRGRSTRTLVFSWLPGRKRWTVSAPKGMDDVEAWVRSVGTLIVDDEKRAQAFLHQFPVCPVAQGADAAPYASCSLRLLCRDNVCLRGVPPKLYVTFPSRNECECSTNTTHMRELHVHPTCRPWPGVSIAKALRSTNAKWSKLSTRVRRLSREFTLRLSCAAHGNGAVAAVRLLGWAPVGV
jgi:hypothetical protein